MSSGTLKKLISLVLAVTVIVCGISFSFGASAEQTSTVVDYSSLTDQTKFDINSYYTTLGMHDGVGLKVLSGALVPDGDWWYQLNAIDKYVDATGAYAIYNVAGNSDFTANFSSGSVPYNMSFLVSEDMVTWANAEADWGLLSSKVTVTVPEKAAFVKIVWPNGGDTANGLVSVEYTKAETDSAFKRFDYAVNKPSAAIDLGDGSAREQTLLKNGVWESNGVEWLSGGVIGASYNALNNATTADSYNGYATYKVKPNTRFGITVTTNKSKPGGTCKIFTDEPVLKMGYEKPQEWNIEIYVSADNVNFTRLEDVNASYSARYPNNASITDAYRSTDYNFIVPDGMLYVKCKYPMTQSLSSISDENGEPIWSYCGNDFFYINKVEFTEIDFDSAYDYWYSGSGDEFISTTLSKENYDDFGVSAANGISYGNTQEKSKGLDVDYNFLWNGGNGAYVTYDVEKGTPFYAGIKIQYPGGLTGYIGEKGSYTVKLQGLNLTTDTWEDAEVLEFDSTYDGSTDYNFYMSEEENVYNRVRVYWPNYYSGNKYYVGNNLACITEVELTHFNTFNLVEGDFNSDSKFDILDLIRYKKIVAGTEKAGMLETDIDGSGKADSGDLARIKKCIVGSAVDLKDYSFDGSISLDVLNNYLDRAVSYNFDIANYDETYVDEGIRLITNVGAKYVQRAAGEWIPHKATEDYYDEMEQKIAEAHAIDPDIIFEAAIFETTGGNVQEFGIPQWAAEAFGSERYNVLFWEQNMLFDEEDGVADNGSNYWGGGLHLPDITKTETQVFIYYKACKYIDMGFEALHLGQTGLTGIADTDNAAWEKVIDLIREYAKTHARRGYVLINSHDKADFVGSDGAKLVDFTMAPCRVVAAYDEVNHEVSEENPQRCDIYYGYGDSVYKAGISGTSPSGWYTEKYPYLVEFDNYSVSSTDTTNKDSYVWGRDEISWFAAQPSWYRTYFMEYITDKIHLNFENGHIALPANRGGGYYANYQSDACPEGTGEENTVKTVLAK